jgi:hypothetical protein
MCLDQGPSWRQRGWPQPVDPMKYLGEQRSWDGNLRHLESDVAAMPHDLGADLDQLLPLRGQRPVLALLVVIQCRLLARTYRLGPFHGTVSLPPKADFRARMFGILLLSSGLPPGSEVPGAAGGRGVLTRCGHRLLDAGCSPGRRLTCRWKLSTGTVHGRDTVHAKNQAGRDRR